MVELEYVKRIKRKKVVAIATGICSIILIALIIVAFLGKNTGTFTINLKTNNVSLALSTTSDFKESTSYLRVANIEQMDTFCYQKFKTDSKYTFDKIDNEKTSYLDNARRNEETKEVIAIPYFKYTFFVKNVGTTAAKFTMSLKIVENTADPSTRKYLDEVVRVIMFEEGKYDKVYAKRSPSSEHDDPIYPQGLTDKEYVCKDILNNPDREVYEGLAEPFTDGETIFVNSKSHFMSQDMIRYTALIWVEGDDDECNGVHPRDAKLKLGVEIQAYED